MEPTVYEICVRGRLTERLSTALEGMALHASAADSVFTGDITRQSQLYGLLDRLRDLGLELISVQPQTEANIPAAKEEPTPISCVDRSHPTPLKASHKGFST